MRLTHVPTGVTVKCSRERTQGANRKIAMQILRAKLLVMLQEQRAEAISAIRAAGRVVYGY